MEVCSALQAAIGSIPDDVRHVFFDTFDTNCIESDVIDSAREFVGMLVQRIHDEAVQHCTPGDYAPTFSAGISALTKLIQDEVHYAISNFNLAVHSHEVYLEIRRRILQEIALHALDIFTTLGTGNIQAPMWNNISLEGLARETNGVSPLNPERPIVHSFIPVVAV